MDNKEITFHKRNKMFTKIMMISSIPFLYLIKDTDASELSLFIASLSAFPFGYLYSNECLKENEEIKKNKVKIKK